MLGLITLDSGMSGSIANQSSSLFLPPPRELQYPVCLSGQVTQRRRGHLQYRYYLQRHHGAVRESSGGRRGRGRGEGRPDRKLGTELGLSGRSLGCVSVGERLRPGEGSPHVRWAGAPSGLSEVPRRSLQESPSAVF